MAHKIPQYLKYTPEELDVYCQTSGSCVKKLNSTFHLNILPWHLKDLKTSIHAVLADNKIGRYDSKLKGIILDMQNIKLFEGSGSIRFDDPRIHIDIVSDCYIFQPTVGAIIRGRVRHVSAAQIGVIVYRVFSVSIRLAAKIEEFIEVDSEIDFRIKKLNIESCFPYIEGELIEPIEIVDVESEAEAKVEPALESEVEVVPIKKEKREKKKRKKGKLEAQEENEENLAKMKRILQEIKIEENNIKTEENNL